MANNRMYIRCRECGEVIIIAKCYGRGYYTIDENLNKILDDFFDEHAYCCKDINDKATEEPIFIKKENIKMENGFEIAYESLEE